MKTELDSAWESAIHNAERARKAEAEIERLQAELAECREDAERYRLFAEQDTDAFDSLVAHATGWWPKSLKHANELLDEKIAARKGEGENNGTL